MTACRAGVVEGSDPSAPMPAGMGSMHDSTFRALPGRLHMVLPRDCTPLDGPHLAVPQPMHKVVIYTTPFCPYCLMAKRLLTKKGAVFEEIDVSGNPALREELRIKAGGRTTVPQIWIDDVHIGGCDELYALDHAGKLDPLLASAPAE